MPPAPERTSSPIQSPTKQGGFLRQATPYTKEYTYEVKPDDRESRTKSPQGFTYTEKGREAPHSSSPSRGESKVEKGLAFTYSPAGAPTKSILKQSPSHDKSSSSLNESMSRSFASTPPTSPTRASDIYSRPTAAPRMVPSTKPQSTSKPSGTSQRSGATTPSSQRDIDSSSGSESESTDESLDEYKAERPPSSAGVISAKLDTSAERKVSITNPPVTSTRTYKTDQDQEESYYASPKAAVVKSYEGPSKRTVVTPTSDRSFDSGTKVTHRSTYGSPASYKYQSSRHDSRQDSPSNEGQATGSPSREGRSTTPSGSVGGYRSGTGSKSSSAQPPKSPSSMSFEKDPQYYTSQVSAGRTDRLDSPQKSTGSGSDSVPAASPTSSGGLVYDKDTGEYSRYSSMTQQQSQTLVTEHIASTGRVMAVPVDQLPQTIVKTETMKYDNDMTSSGATTSTKTVPVVSTETRKVAYSVDPPLAQDGLPSGGQYSTTKVTTQHVPPHDISVEQEGEIISQQTISSKTRTVETVTYKMERDGVVETRVEQKITIQSDGDPIDHDKALAEAIQEATMMNPDLKVEKIEIQQQQSGT